jgi:hypothetical protein
MPLRITSSVGADMRASLHQSRAAETHVRLEVRKSQQHWTKPTGLPAPWGAGGESQFIWQRAGCKYSLQTLRLKNGPAEINASSRRTVRSDARHFRRSFELRRVAGAGLCHRGHQMKANFALRRQGKQRFHKRPIKRPNGRYRGGSCRKVRWTIAEAEFTRSRDSGLCSIRMSGCGVRPGSSLPVWRIGRGNHIRAAMTRVGRPQSRGQNQ